METNFKKFAGKIDVYAAQQLAEIADFWVASWAKTMPAIDFEQRRGWFLAHMEALSSNGIAIRVAIAEDAKIAGVITVDPRDGHIDQICVNPEWWGCGVAEALMATARQISPEQLKLDVNADNPRAFAFYVREGFEECGRDTNPRSGLPIIRMLWMPSERSS